MRSGYWDEGQYKLGHGSNGNHDRKFESEGSGLVGGADLVSHRGSGAHVLLDQIPLKADGVSCWDVDQIAEILHSALACDGTDGLHDPDR